MPKVLVIATSSKTRGGITSVVNAHRKGAQWEKYNCKWIETHIDTNKFMSLCYLFIGYLKFLFHLPTAKILHIHLSQPVSAMRKLLFFIPAYFCRKKIIVHFHAFSTETTINSSSKWIYRFIFSRAKKVIVLSNSWKEAVYKAFNINNIEIVYNPCATIIGSTEYAKKKNILYAGTINERKGYADMIRAFAKIAAEHKEWKIVFAGNGEIEEGKSLAKELGIEEQTLFLGWLNGEKKDKAFKEASIFCLPSYFEGFPMAVLDAWTYELPVITTPVGGITDIAKHKENMLVFTPGDTEKLAECMQMLIEDNELYNKIKAASIHFAKETFNIEVINKQIEKIYDEIAKM